MTLKKQRQRMACKFKKALGIDFSLAKKLARFNMDRKDTFDNIKDLLRPILGEPTFFKGCDCCGDSRFIWTSKKKTLVFEFISFRLV